LDNLFKQLKRGRGVVAPTTCRAAIYVHICYLAPVKKFEEKNKNFKTTRTSLHVSSFSNALLLTHPGLVRHTVLRYRLMRSGLEQYDSNREIYITIFKSTGTCF
jgi:hypothetical protein